MVRFLESTYPNNCVKRAISTIRALCGLDPKLEFFYEVGIHNNKFVYSVIHENLKDREVLFWTREEECHFLPNAKYMGDYFDSNQIDDTKYVLAYAFNEGSKGHMVIGFPASGYTYDIGLVIAVKLED